MELLEQKTRIEFVPVLERSACMKVIRADAMGMCFGVRDALQIAELVERPERVTIHGELVHNRAVLVQLQSRGFRITPEGHRRPLPNTPEVLVTAHGVSDVERQRLEAAGKRIIDTTCPLVRRVHRAARSLSAQGYHVLVIGRPGHVEVQGIVEDLAEYNVLERPDDVRAYVNDKLGVVCQTTTPPKWAEEIRTAIRAHNPRATIHYVDTICQPTLDRQQALARLLRLVDAVVVVGGRNSNNTRQLVTRCRDFGVPALHVQSADNLDPKWFDVLGRCEAVGLTAGTSTLESTIQKVYEVLCELSVRIREKIT